MDDGNNSIGEDAVRRDYAAIMSQLPPRSALTLLHIGSDRTILATADSVLSLPIGADKTGSQFFHHTPPTPDEFEHAINTIEDELAGIQKRIDATSALHTRDAAIRDIGRLAVGGDQHEIALTRDSMEALFSRVAALSMGRSAVIDQLQANPSFSARLLILREVMFHLGFTIITIVP